MVTVPPGAAASIVAVVAKRRGEQRPIHVRDVVLALGDYAAVEGDDALHDLLASPDRLPRFLQRALGVSDEVATRVVAALGFALMEHPDEVIDLRPARETSPRKG